MSRSGASPVGSSSSTWRLYFKSASRVLDPPSSVPHLAEMASCRRPRSRATQRPCAAERAAASSSDPALPPVRLRARTGLGCRTPGQRHRSEQRGSGRDRAAPSRGRARRARTGAGVGPPAREEVASAVHAKRSKGRMFTDPGWGAGGRHDRPPPGSGERLDRGRLIGGRAGHRVGLWFSKTPLLGLAGVVVADDARLEARQGHGVLPGFGDAHDLRG